MSIGAMPLPGAGVVIGSRLGRDPTNSVARVGLCQGADHAGPGRSPAHGIMRTSLRGGTLCARWASRCGAARNRVQPAR